jgi:hypothetical protein
MHLVLHDPDLEALGLLHGLHDFGVRQVTVTVLPERHADDPVLVHVVEERPADGPVQNRVHVGIIAEEMIRCAGLSQT